MMDPTNENAVVEYLRALTLIPRVLSDDPDDPTSLTVARALAHVAENLEPLDRIGRHLAAIATLLEAQDAHRQDRPEEWEWTARLWQVNDLSLVDLGIGLSEMAAQRWVLDRVVPLEDPSHMGTPLALFRRRIAPPAEAVALPAVFDEDDCDDVDSGLPPGVTTDYDLRAETGLEMVEE